MKKVIATNNAPAAIGPYSQAIEVNGMIFLSGQLPIDPATGDFPDGGAKEQTEQCFKNIKAILAEAGLTTDNIVKTTVLLNDIALFADMNEVYAAQFSGSFPARSAFAVKDLPKAALVEIEVVAARQL
jgi:2-iminobutanoate/2-iminopropanoate deaminase